MVDKVVVGQKYNWLTVLKLYKIGKREFAQCLCDCGNISNPREFDIRKGNRYSCGCYHNTELKSKINKTHGMTYTSEYETWCKMKSRCFYKGNNRYYRYGARGITVCDRWLHSFENFYEDMGSKPSKKYSIDRIDNDGNYCPENCRWATAQQQNENQSYHGGKGVSFTGGKYVVSMSRRKLRIYLGAFKDSVSALSISNKFKRWFDVNEDYIRESKFDGKEVSLYFLKIINYGK